MKKSVAYLYLLGTRMYTYMYSLRVLIAAAILVGLLIVLLMGEVHISMHMHLSQQALGRLSPPLDDHDPWD